MQRELITFQVAGQLFGLDILSIREIRAWSPVTRLPQVPDFVCGVVNLRGTVLPVYDLSSRLGWAKTDATPRNPIIVTECASKSRGLIVDCVNDIVTVSDADIQRPEAVEYDDISGFMQGLVPLGEDMVILLDLRALLGEDQIELAA